MQKPHRLKLILCILGFIILGYLRHLLILHANVAQSNSGFEFNHEHFAGLLDFFKSFGNKISWVEKSLQIFFAFTFGYLSYLCLKVLNISGKTLKLFALLFLGFCIFSALCTIAFQALGLTSLQQGSSLVFVKMQGPLPLLIFYLMVRVGLIEIR